VSHVTDRQLCAFLDDVLVGPPDDETARHLGSCALCHARYEGWARADDAFRALLARPADEDALERWSCWVEAAVNADRGGAQLPEAGLLRLPLPAARRATARVAAASHPPRLPRYATRRPAGAGAPTAVRYAIRGAEFRDGLPVRAFGPGPADTWLPLAFVGGLLVGVLLVLLLMRG